MKLNKRLFLCLIFVISSLSGTQLLNGQDESPDQPLDLYLLIGQSNMAGRAPFTEEEAKPLENCYLLNNEDKWEIAKNPLNRHSTIRKGLNAQKLNPGYSFTKVMLAENGETPIGLIVNAKGGSKIEEWAKEPDSTKKPFAAPKKLRKTEPLKVSSGIRAKAMKRTLKHTSPNSSHSSPIYAKTSTAPSSPSWLAK